MADAAHHRDHAVDDDELITWWGLVIEGYHATQNRLMSELHAAYGLPPAQVDVLLRLVRTPGHRMPMTRLAREAALSSGGFTKVADKLVAQQLIERVQCSADRRVVYAALTDTGLEQAGLCRRAVAGALRCRVLDPLGPEAATTLATAMRLLRARNGDSGDGAAPDIPGQGACEDSSDVSS